MAWPQRFPRTLTLLVCFMRDDDGSSLRMVVMNNMVSIIMHSRLECYECP